MYNFDKVVDRTATDSIKWNHPKVKEGLLPLWVADMDFEILPEITQAIQDRASHPLYGYTSPSEDYKKAVISWMERRHGLHVDPDSIVVTNGVVSALRTAVQAFTQPGDNILIFRPVYYPFSRVIEEAGRNIINTPLKQDNTIDWEAVDAALDNVKMLIFCSPHNPVGRVWTPAELRKLADLCLEHDVLLVSDEIHMDLTAPDVVHTPLWVAAPEIREKSILCTAPSKTFNLAGLSTSNIFIENPELRGQFKRTQSLGGADMVNVFGLAACQAAYENGDAWVDEVNAYIHGNFEYVEAFLKEHLPEAVLTRHEGTYLAWIDFSALGIEDLDAKMEEIGLFLDGGTMFGPEGKGFQRFNLAAPRATVEAAMERLLKLKP